MTKTTLIIDDMACSMCEAHVSEAIRRGCKPKKLRASHKTGTVELLTERFPDEVSLERAVEATGSRNSSIALDTDDVGRHQTCSLAWKEQSIH